MKKIELTKEFAGKTLKLTTGNIAQQASGAVLAQYGDTVVLATVVAAPLQRELDYFPLSVEYMEKLYAGGRIKGSRWVKREGRPNDDEILAGRLIDRSIRPLFPKSYKKDVQVILTVLSVDFENDPSIVAGMAASAAIAISPLPWKGPVGIVKMGLVDGKLVVNPTTSELKTSTLELVVSGTKDAVVMIEAGASQVTEAEMLSAIEDAHKQVIKFTDIISEFEKKVGNTHEEAPKEEIDVSIAKKVKELVKDELPGLMGRMVTKESSYGDYDLFKKGITDNFEDEASKGVAAKALENEFKLAFRKMILSGKRPDGRGHDEIRPLSSEVGILPRTHGTGLFQRGQTQVLSITTLGARSMEQTIESAEGEETKRYIHHYTMPPFSVGEAGRVGSPSRREIGHGALAERAIEAVIPDEAVFPYTMRVVSEVLSSNGSTSMASVCGSTLSLMDAGVPIKGMVAGIAMGLVIESEKEVAVLTDIVGFEDNYGDMDFKVAGTEAGITAMQMDVKSLSLTLPILEKAVEKAREARLKILEVMKAAISTPRAQVSAYAPKIKMITIPVEKIGEVIGSGGKTIKKISADTGVQLDVEDDGSVSFAGTDLEAVDRAIAIVEALVKEFIPGEIYEGTVVRIENFGAFVNVLPGKDGMVHVSDMSTDYVKDPNDIVQLDDKVQVRVKEVDKLGRLNLSMVMDPSFDKKKEEDGGSSGGRGGYSGGSRGGYGGGSRGGYDRGPRSFDRGSRGGGRSFDRGSRSSFDRGSRPDRSRASDQGNDRGPRSSGPHFPASRLMDQGNKDFGR